MTRPQQLRPCIVVLSEAESRRVHRAVVIEGSVERARQRLGIGHQTMDAARDQGRMMAATRDRLLAALDRMGA